MIGRRLEVEPAWRSRLARGSALGLTLVAVCAAIALAGPLADPVPGVNYEEGNFCVQDYRSGAVCEANDVRIASVVPTIEEACLTAQDTATVQFKFEFVAGASERYDIGLFVATDGGSALSGDSCYHDYLQPASAEGPWDLLSGSGPFKDLETGDFCADIEQGATNYYLSQVPITVQCMDADDDGVVDPFSVCTSWDNNAGQACNDVKGAFPGTPSKCRCETGMPNPPILLYEGYDWGDLPDSYATLKATDGAHHAIQDVDQDGVPDTQGGVPAVWLGETIDYSPHAETDGMPDPAAAGDDLANTDDEDGVTLPPDNWTHETGGQINVEINSSTGECTGCTLGFWFDWNGDGDFGTADVPDADEWYTAPVVFGNQTLSFAVPEGVFPASIYARFRLYGGSYVGPIVPAGLAVNGEVEDYVFTFGPNAVSLSGLAAGPAASAWPAAAGLVTILGLAGVGLRRRRAAAAAATDD